MFCHKCGNPLIEDSVFCQKCGTKVIVAQVPAITQNGTITTFTPGPMPQALNLPDPAVQKSQHTPLENVSSPAATNGNLRKVANCGRVIMGIFSLLLFISAFVDLPINPIILGAGVVVGIFLSALNIKRPIRISKILELAIAVALLVFYIIGAVVLFGRDDKYVSMVKGGTLEAYPQTTVGNAFGDFMPDAKWESLLADDGKRYVNVRGTIQYMEKDVEAVVQFLIDSDNDRFEYNAFEMNGIPQNNLMFWALLEAAYGNTSGDYDTEDIGAAQPSTSTGQSNASTSNPDAPTRPDEPPPATHMQKPEALYASILDIYARGFSSEGNRIDSAEYAFYDIDSSGIVELIVNYVEYSGPYTTIYSYVEGAIYMLGTVGPRSWIDAIDNKGYIYSSGSNSAFSGGAETRRISDDKKSFITIELWSYDFDSGITEYTSPNGVTREYADNESNYPQYPFWGTGSGVVDLLSDLAWTPIYLDSGSNALQPNRPNMYDEEFFQDIFIGNLSGTFSIEGSASYNMPWAYISFFRNSGFLIPDSDHFLIRFKSVKYGAEYDYNGKLCFRAYYTGDYTGNPEYRESAYVDPYIELLIYSDGNWHFSYDDEMNMWGSYRVTESNGYYTVEMIAEAGAGW